MIWVYWRKGRKSADTIACSEFEAEGLDVQYLFSLWFVDFGLDGVRL